MDKEDMQNQFVNKSKSANSMKVSSESIDEIEAIEYKKYRKEIQSLQEIHLKTLNEDINNDKKTTSIIQNITKDIEYKLNNLNEIQILKQTHFRGTKLKGEILDRNMLKDTKNNYVCIVETNELNNRNDLNAISDSIDIDGSTFCKEVSAPTKNEVQRKTTLETVARESNIKKSNEDGSMCVESLFSSIKNPFKNGFINDSLKKLMSTNENKTLENKDLIHINNSTRVNYFDMYNRQFNTFNQFNSSLMDVSKMYSSSNENMIDFNQKKNSLDIQANKDCMVNSEQILNEFISFDECTYASINDKIIVENGKKNPIFIESGKNNTNFTRNEKINDNFKIITTNGKNNENSTTLTMNGGNNKNNNTIIENGASITENRRKDTTENEISSFNNKANTNIVLKNGNKIKENLIKNKEDENEMINITHLNSDEIKQFSECKHCSTQFDLRYINTLLKHCRSCVGINRTNVTYGKYIYTCYLCGIYNTYKSTNMKKHILTHLKLKAFSCNYCTYTCINRSDLQRHLRKHTGEKPYSCYACDYRSSRTETLKKHMYSIHGIKHANYSIPEYNVYKALLNQSEIIE